MRWSGGRRGKIGIGGLSSKTHTKARSGEIDGVDGGWPTGVGVSGVGERERGNKKAEGEIIRSYLLRAFRDSTTCFICNRCAKSIEKTRQHCMESPRQRFSPVVLRYTHPDEHSSPTIRLASSM